jgi:predicted nucleic acid-binding protein
MVKSLLDTNILIDYLNGQPLAKRTLAIINNPLISIITWMEVMAGVRDVDEAVLIKTWLDRFVVIGIDQSIAQRAVELRRTRRLKLPDAIIWATAKEHDALLVSRNIKDFPESEVDVQVPYTI